MDGSTELGGKGGGRLVVRVQSPKASTIHRREYEVPEGVCSRTRPPVRARHSAHMANKQERLLDSGSMETGSNCVTSIASSFGVQFFTTRLCQERVVTSAGGQRDASSIVNQLGRQQTCHTRKTFGVWSDTQLSITQIGSVSKGSAPRIWSHASQRRASRLTGCHERERSAFPARKYWHHLRPRAMDLGRRKTHGHSLIRGGGGRAGVSPPECLAAAHNPHLLARNFATHIRRLRRGLREGGG